MAPTTMWFRYNRTQDTRLEAGAGGTITPNSRAGNDQLE